MPGRLLDGLAPAPTSDLLADMLRRARATRLPGGRYAPLAQWLQTDVAPLAALQAWASGISEKDDLWLVTPTHFQAGMDDLVMMPPELIQLVDDEKHRLAETLQEYFELKPALIETGGQWFLHAPGIDIRSVPLHEAVGRSIRPILPRGADATRVHAWMNEMQMALHAAPLNDERMARGLPPVNGVWFWGEGEIPAELPAAMRTAKFAGRGKALRLADGLAHAVGGQVAGQELSEENGNVFVIDTLVAEALDAEELDRWHEQREELLQRWLEPALAKLRAGSADCLRLYPGDGYMYEITRGDLRRFWRGWRRKPATAARAETISHFDEEQE